MQAEVSQTSDRPAISIVIPVFNAEDTLDECIESLKAQTFGDWEAVCVNDGSHDGSLEKLQRFAEEDARIRVFTQENAGPSAARNAALDAARGEIVMFLDCDDWYEPNACETVRHAFRDGEVDIMAFGATCVPESAAPKHVRDLLSPYDEIIAGFTPDVLFSKHAQPYIARIAARRAFLDEHHVRFATDIKLAEDTAFLLEAYPHARKTALSSAKLYNYRMNGESITHGLNSANATKAKLDQHLAAIEHILANWRENKLVDLCSGRMVEWILDFTLFDISRLSVEQQANYIERLDNLLAETFGNYSALPRKAAVKKAAEHVSKHECSKLFSGLLAKLAFVRFFVATRGLKQCIERFL